MIDDVTMSGQGQNFSESLGWVEGVVAVERLLTAVPGHVVAAVVRTGSDQNP